jgi:hypothetical protein
MVFSSFCYWFARGSWRKLGLRAAVLSITGLCVWRPKEELKTIVSKDSLIVYHEIQNKTRSVRNRPNALNADF